MHILCELAHHWSKARWGLVKIEGEFHNRTTTPECSEDWTAVPSMEKTESELCVCTQCASTLHTHIWRTAQLSGKTHAQKLKHLHYFRKLKTFFLQTSSIRTTTFTAKPTTPTLGSLSDSPTGVTQNVNCAYVLSLPNPKPADITHNSFPETNRILYFTENC